MLRQPQKESLGPCPGCWRRQRLAQDSKQEERGERSIKTCGIKEPGEGSLEGVTVRINTGESKEVLEALPRAWSPLRGMQREVWLEEGPESRLGP